MKDGPSAGFGVPASWSQGRWRTNDRLGSARWVSPGGVCSARSNTVRIANTEFLRIDGRPSEVETARSAGPPIAPRRVLSLSPARELHEQRFLGRSTHFLITPRIVCFVKPTHTQRAVRRSHGCEIYAGSILHCRSVAGLWTSSV